MAPSEDTNPIEQSGGNAAATDGPAAAVYGHRFVIENELGRGAMGRVLRARDLKLGRPVAIKVLAPGRQAPDQRLRFEREARAAGALNHPNIMAVHDVGEQDGAPYIVAELLDGQRLRDLLATGALRSQEAHEFAAQLAAGLAAAHAHGIVHRDLKPENIFVTEGGTLKILDFGIAKLSEADTGAALTGTGAILGTPAYMSPEQVRAQPASTRSDVFAFGAVLHEMLSGTAPFARTSAVETGYAILHDAPPALPASVPPHLAGIVERCLEKNPAARFADGNEVLAAIRNPPRKAIHVRWSSWLTLVAAGVLATAVLLYPSGLRRLRTTAVPPSVAVLPFANLSSDQQQEYFSDGLSEELLSLLARVPGLRVAARTSSFAFKGKMADVREIAAMLHVATVLEGSVRKAGDRIRIDARLVSAADGYELWSETYDRRLTDVFAVQDDIARAVVSALKLRLMEGPTARNWSTRNPEAYNEYLLGRQFFRRNNAGGFRYATQSFRKAVTLDPGYAPAWAALAMGLYLLADSEPSANAVAADQELAVAAAGKAVEVGTDVPDGYVARAMLRIPWRWDWTGARTDLERALALSPDDADVLGIYGIAQLRAWGRASEAIATFRRALELDPLNAGTWNSLGVALATDGELHASRDAFGRSLEISPEQSFTPYNLGWTFLLEGEPVLAASAFERCTEEAFRLAGAAMAEHDRGHIRESRAALGRLVARFAHSSAYQIAEAFAWVGENDHAFEWLERARLQRDGGLAHAKVDPLLRSLRADPRYAALLAKINLPIR